jgi:TPR repeat protein
MISSFARSVGVSCGCLAVIILSGLKPALGQAKPSLVRPPAVVSKPAVKPVSPVLSAEAIAELEKKRRTERLQLAQANRFMVRKQYKKAFVLLNRNRRSTAFDDRALLNLGRCYLLIPPKTPARLNRAATLLKQVTQNKAVGSEANYLLGDLYLNGSNGFPANVPKAVGYFQQANKRNNRAAQCRLGQIYLNGTGGITPDQAHGIELLEEAANAGYTDAQWTLAVLFTQGTDQIPKDIKRAKFWYQKIALTHPINLTNSL